MSRRATPAVPPRPLPPARPSRSCCPRTNLQQRAVEKKRGHATPPTSPGAVAEAVAAERLCVGLRRVQVQEERFVPVPANKGDGVVPESLRQRLEVDWLFNDVAAVREEAPRRHLLRGELETATSCHSTGRLRCCASSSTQAAGVCTLR